jgi:serine/threonine-protein kinase
VSLSGASGLLCGFIDSDASNNRGAIRLRLTQQQAESPAPSVRPAPKPALASDQADAIYEDAIRLFRAKQSREATVLGNKCLELKPDYAKCHMLLGATNARLLKIDVAAKHYREFLRLAPDDTSAPRVRKVLEDYDKAQGASRQ